MEDEHGDKYLYQCTPLEDGQYQFKEIRNSEDDIDIEAQKKARGYGLKRLTKDNNLVLPLVVDNQMRDVPCLRVEKENHRITLNLITEDENEIKELMQINVVPILYMIQLNFDQFVNEDGYPTYNEIQICQRQNVQEDSSQEMMVALRLSSKLVVFQVYKISYKALTASLIA